MAGLPLAGATNAGVVAGRAHSPGLLRNRLSRGLGFTLEGFSFFLEAIFIAIYVHGWDRIPPRRHFLAGIPVAIAGVAGFRPRLPLGHLKVSA
ncbi:cytochrome ubiquinol oxidase subunit I [Amycolatopsis sp. NBC_01488]|uniref:cytochrome ubiquinol oxidase subunit I n=1 Tax=Amycolatopsis sp. NBC_01488 TaxID=2903563 RepID=UPI002E28FDDA|nr:cytochrome ubiquinol oxidase subunit I [Amycolatopsis sp. NBC_01488]